MTSKCIALIVAAGLLTACGTTKTSTTADVPNAAPQKRLVVRGAIVPDDPEISSAPAAARVKKTASAAGGVRPSRPVLADGSASGGTSTTPTAPATPPPASSDSTGAGAPLVAPGSSGGSGSGGSGTPTSGTPGGSGTETSTPGIGDVTTEALAPIEPATVSAEPAPTPSRPTSSFSLFGFDVGAMMNASVAGFPLWMIVLVAILLAGALVFGTGGGRKRAREEYREEPPARDDRRYEDDEPVFEGRRDGEPQPA